MAKADSAYTWKLWALVVLVIVFLILLTIALASYKDFHSCSTNREIWCYEDWICPEEPAGSKLRQPAVATQKTSEGCGLENDGSNTCPTSEPDCCKNLWPFLDT